MYQKAKSSNGQSSVFSKMKDTRKFHDVVVTQNEELLNRGQKTASESEVQIYVRGAPFTLNMDLLALKSAKVAEVLEENPHEDLSYILRDIATDVDTFEIVARFCYGFEVSICTENAVPLCCLAYHLGMTESHCLDNLLEKTIAFIQQKILPNWNECIKALRTSESVLKQALNLHLLPVIIDSIAATAVSNPCLLGEPMQISRSNDDDGDDSNDNGNVYMPSARRRLFEIDDCKSEDLTTLSIELYEHIIHDIVQRKGPLNYVVASVCRYADKWIFSITDWEDMSNSRRNLATKVIEAVERLLPYEQGLLPCTTLFKMLRYSISLEASIGCRKGFERRIGKQLHRATVEDLLIPSRGYTKEVQYDIECVKGILKSFYTNYVNHVSTGDSGLRKVADLMEDFLAEIASDIDLKVETFVVLAEMVAAVSLGSDRYSDGIYRAIDIFLEKHKFLIDSEKEEVCRMLECDRMTAEACKHAATNERLPLRTVVQVLFVSQLKLRGTMIAKETPAECEKSLIVKVEEEEEVKQEMEKMGSKVIELEKECLIMKKEIESGCSKAVKKEKSSLWKEMKRKLGCGSSMYDYNCQVKKKKKVHPR